MQCTYMHRTEQNRTTAAEERRGDALLREVFRAHHNFHLLFFLSEARVAEGRRHSHSMLGGGGEA